MTTVYRVTVYGLNPWQRVVKSELRRHEVGQATASLLDQVGYDEPQVRIERIERQILTLCEIDEQPTRPSILVLDPWGMHPGQTNKISAIKAIRMLDPGRLDLKAAKDIVEGGGEIFCPWDLTAKVAQYISSGLREYQVYAQVCVRTDETGPEED